MLLSLYLHLLPGLLTSSWRWRQQDPLNRWYLITSLHSVRIQKITTWIFMGVKTGNLALKIAVKIKCPRQDSKCDPQNKNPACYLRANPLFPYLWVCQWYQMSTQCMPCHQVTHEQGQWMEQAGCSLLSPYPASQCPTGLALLSNQSDVQRTGL